MGQQERGREMEGETKDMIAERVREVNPRRLRRE